MAEIEYDTKMMELRGRLEKTRSEVNAVNKILIAEDEDRKSVV